MQRGTYNGERGDSLHGKLYRPNMYLTVSLFLLSPGFPTEHEHSAVRPLLGLLSTHRVLFPPWALSANHRNLRTLQPAALFPWVRCHARHLRETRAFELCGLGAILLIQRVIRGFLVRQAYERRFREAVRVRVIVPAAGVLQKCWRGKKGREEAALRRRMRAAAIEIQARTEKQAKSYRAEHHRTWTIPDRITFSVSVS